MRPIPKKLREDMASDPYYRMCCVTGKQPPMVDIEWHHNLIYAGQQVNEKWCILPLAAYVHAIEKQPEVKEVLNWIMYNRATDEELRQYSVGVDLVAERKRLNELFRKRYGSAKTRQVDIPGVGYLRPRW